jgi:hypothetical protein
VSGIFIGIIFGHCSNDVFSHYGQKQHDLPWYSLHSNSILSGGRHIRLLAHVEDINEENLRRLMKYFFEKYPDPERLYVFFSSDPAYFAVNINGVGDEFFKQFASGVLIRHKGNELFRFNLEGQESKTVVIKGSDPFK